MNDTILSMIEFGKLQLEQKKAKVAQDKAEVEAKIQAVEKAYFEDLQELFPEDIRKFICSDHFFINKETKCHIIIPGLAPIEFFYYVQSHKISQNGFCVMNYHEGYDDMDGYSPYLDYVSDGVFTDLREALFYASDHPGQTFEEVKQVCDKKNNAKKEQKSNQNIILTCPLFGPNGICLKGGCAFWITGSNKCAAKVIAENI
jgi:hypothetical protein